MFSMNPFLLREVKILKRCISTMKSLSPQLDFEYICDPVNSEEIKSRIKRRKGEGDVDLVRKLYSDLSSTGDPSIRQRLIKEALKIPNKSHPRLLGLKDEPEVIKTIGDIKQTNFKPKTFEELARKLKLIRTDTSCFTGSRSYYLIDQLAQLELALVNYSVSKLKRLGFEFISVPDILPKHIIEYCGFNTEGERTQVYKLENLGDDLCLSGTAEMGIAAYLQNKEFSSDELPIKLAAVSRCFRAETSRISEEKGLYRVHQFTKVEMFGVATCEGSAQLLEEFREYEEETFAELGLVLRVLDMPECELGAQAYRKYDVEAFMPGKKKWGEISSTSNCTDYQARRLNIKYDGQFAHTINGTACAVPRMIIALMETHQNKNGTVEMPKQLVPYLGSSTIGMSSLPKIKLSKGI
ncbi:serine--tRNA ligase, mitochondrial [Cimex lectularius]|uniref:serine--tRNA ligase n=1 Tax=Cimex lectularius TaxID=79782 RepID=A0A8I6TEV5_CIMLE|nr:serine--tRNA ligase, mitochondrial [Cimex lectularius]